MFIFIPMRSRRTRTVLMDSGRTISTHLIWPTTALSLIPDTLQSPSPHHIPGWTPHRTSLWSTTRGYPRNTSWMDTVGLVSKGRDKPCEDSHACWISKPAISDLGQCSWDLFKAKDKSLHLAPLLYRSARRNTKRGRPTGFRAHAPHLGILACIYSQKSS